MSDENFEDNQKENIILPLISSNIFLACGGRILYEFFL
jgi:hypothetical protein